MKKSCFIFAFSLLFLSGCIKNDIPYPKVLAEIKDFEVRGQISRTIDLEDKTVSLEIADSVDLAKVRLMKFEVTNDAKVTPDITAMIDLTNPITYTLSTYQDYVWTIKATQVIDRYIKVENQIGDPIIDADGKLILITVAGSQDLFNTKILDIKLGATGEEILPDPYTVKDFSLPRQFVSTFKGVPTTWTIRLVKSSITIVTGSASAFAKYVFLDGQCQAGSAAPSFQYKEATSDSWIDVSSSDVTVDGGNFSAKVTGLTPETTYEYRSVQGSNYGQIKTFVTEKILTLPNLSFDEWIMDGKSWFPDKDLSEANYFWDSGNKGANTLTSKNPTSPEEIFVVSGKAVKMASTAVVGVFAAGNIYTGKYLKTAGIGAELAFGQPFTGRPKALKGYYNYTPGIIDASKDPYKSMEGQSDCCHMYIVLADWGAPFAVNTKEKQFLNLDEDPGIIAIGQLMDDKASGSKYKEFEIPLTYKSLTRKPTHILIVAAASKYGDYFTGSTKSVLYIDEFELVY